MDVRYLPSFINFGAFLAFSLVNLSVVFHYYLGAERRGPETLLFLVFPGIRPGRRPVVDESPASTIWRSSSASAGWRWALVYLAAVTHGFREPPPEMRFEGLR